MDDLTVLIHTADNKCFSIDALDGMTIETSRKGQAGRLKFQAIQDDMLDIQEGCIVQVKIGNTGVFQGIVFSRSLDKDNIISVLAYDQLRYLKNRQVFNTTNKKASEIIKMIADDFGIKCGELIDTEYVIPRFRAGEQTLFDLMQTAIDITTQAQKKLFVLYDDFGKLTLKNMEDMRVDILIDSETAENFSFESTIDKDTYNQIKLYFDNKETGKREVWLVKDSNNISKWGLLQLSESVNPKKPINLVDKANEMLKRYNRVRRSLSIKNALGDYRVRGGSTIWVQLHVDNKDIGMRMLVENVVHKFANNEHFMDLQLRGGIFE